LLFVVDCGQADGLYAPTSFAVAATVRNYNLEFCHEWSINVQDTLNGVPGVLYGRYPGDTYAGGNPWVLSSSALANLFYRAAAYVSAHGLPSDQAARDAWADVFGEQLPSDAAAAAQVERPTHRAWPNFFNPRPCCSRAHVHFPWPLSLCFMLCSSIGVWRGVPLFRRREDATHHETSSSFSPGPFSI
jgi:hypothetical protein